MSRATHSSQPELEQLATTSKVLVVDDEQSITELVSTALELEGFTTDSAANGSEAVNKVMSGHYDLLILDIMLPDLWGVDVCKYLREKGDKTPIIFLTAKDTIEDKVEGLTVGGDDYITKPFSLDELIARTYAVLRRSTSEGNNFSNNRIVFEDLVLCLDTYEVWKAGHLVELTPTEFKLLNYLAINPRQVLTRTQIIANVWGIEFQGDYSIVETYISYLRKKLEGFGLPLIQTIRGIGYSLRLPNA